VLESLASEAGLTPQRTFDISYAFEYRDEETLGRLLTAPMGLAELAGPEREPPYGARSSMRWPHIALPTGATGSPTSSTTWSPGPDRRAGTRA
jgi:hypothetical protein